MPNSYLFVASQPLLKSLALEKILDWGGQIKWLQTFLGHDKNERDLAQTHKISTETKSLIDLAGRGARREICKIETREGKSNERKLSSGGKRERNPPRRLASGRVEQKS